MVRASHRLAYILISVSIGTAKNFFENFPGANRYEAIENVAEGLAFLHGKFSSLIFLIGFINGEIRQTPSLRLFTAT